MEEVVCGPELPCGERDEATMGATAALALALALDALIDAREQLEEYETDATGEVYNSIKLNFAIAKAREVMAALPASATAAEKLATDAEQVAPETEDRRSREALKSVAPRTTREG